jgi:hypothetical protein
MMPNQEADAVMSGRLLVQNQARSSGQEEDSNIVHPGSQDHLQWDLPGWGTTLQLGVPVAHSSVHPHLKSLTAVSPNLTAERPGCNNIVWFYDYFCKSNITYRMWFVIKFSRLDFLIQTEAHVQWIVQHMFVAMYLQEPIIKGSFMRFNNSITRLHSFAATDDTGGYVSVMRPHHSAVLSITGIQYLSWLWYGFYWCSVLFLCQKYG